VECDVVGVFGRRAGVTAPFRPSSWGVGLAIRLEIRQRAFERATKKIGWLQIVVAVIIGIIATLLTLAALPDNAMVWKMLRRPAPSTAPAPEERL